MNNAETLQNLDLANSSSIKSEDINHLKFYDILDNSGDNFSFDAISGGFTRKPREWPRKKNQVINQPEIKIISGDNFGLKELDCDF